MSQKRVHAGFAASAIAPAPSGLAVFGGQGHHRYRSRFSDRNRRLLGGSLLRLDLKLDPENRGIYTQSDSSKKSSRNIWSLAVVSVDQRY